MLPAYVAVLSTICQLGNSILILLVKFTQSARSVRTAVRRIATTWEWDWFYKFNSTSIKQLVFKKTAYNWTDIIWLFIEHQSGLRPAVSKEVNWNYIDRAIKAFLRVRKL